MVGSIRRRSLLQYLVAVLRLVVVHYAGNSTTVVAVDLAFLVNRMTSSAFVFEKYQFKVFFLSFKDDVAL